MAEKGWLMGFLTTAGDVLATIGGAILGVKWGEKPTATREVLRKGADVAREYLTPDREDILKELDRLGDLAKPLRNFIDRTNMEGCIIRIRDAAGKVIERKAETWLINMLLKVEPRDRQAFLTNLTALYEDAGENGPQALIARLKTLDNDWYVQYPRMVAEAFADKAKEVRQSMPSDAEMAAKIRSFRKSQGWLRPRRSR